MIQAVRPVSDPSPEEIAAACLEIQAGWSESERRSRLNGTICLLKHEADGVERAALMGIGEKLAKRRERLQTAS